MELIYRYNPFISEPKLGSKVLLFVCFFFCTINLFGQETEDDPFEDDSKKKYHFGVSAGMGFHTLKSQELINSTYRFGLNVGIIGNRKLGEIFKIQAELNGSFRGSNFKNRPTEIGGMSFFYIDLPIYLTASFGKSTKITPFAGIQGSQMIFRELYLVDDKLPVDDYLSLNRYDASLVFGTQINPNNYYGFQFKTIIGLVDINRNLSLPYKPQTGKDLPIKNMGFQLAVVF